MTANGEQYVMTVSQRRMLKSYAGSLDSHITSMLKSLNITSSGKVETQSGWMTSSAMDLKDTCQYVLIGVGEPIIVDIAKM